ncbi:MAG TPA: MFS transporter [Glutamicibacter sp.]|uniref:MFS superfamily transporter n=1 Tax=Glutamicibacter arilaitensis (strain DSM 16368 / CIP 108037 / IAM 15318 / JCM 13566 / NCIMB 14258 / Re117) TaxID=861360 RepID=A0ABP1U0N2_GLUAR|nr:MULTISPECIES: MFS transporter [Glutamicibacter]CBT74928.1 MFS superfamily transporter [Glutamicibacter arilaitensis Re117]HCH46899.1 MFS transporter [Glutamicibacter sp.]
MTQPKAAKANQRRVAFATVIGTTVEWYDFFIYATAAGLVFSQLFFEPAGQDIALLISFASVGLSFLFRPLGAFLAGHFGDKIGRRAMLVLTLALMGAATTLIGVLPTYETAGIWAPIMLLLLRILQGISAGGEWGGAVLMAVEHASDGHRGRAGSYPQVGVPLGMLLASGTMALMTGVISPGDAFLEWGWRVPFLVSIVLIAVGYFVRRSVDESPVFEEISENKAQTAVPILVLFKKHWPLVLIAALVFAGNNAAGYMTTGGFFQAYTTNPEGPVGLERTDVLIAVAFGAAVWLVMTLVAGYLADRIGRKRTYQLGFIILAASLFPVFALVNSGSLVLLYAAFGLFSIGLGLTYGPQAALYSELFPASVRFSGVSNSYAIGAIVGGAFAPTIAQALVQATGGTTAVAVYLLIVVAISFTAVSMIRDRSGIDLSFRNQAEQEVGALVFDKRRADAVKATQDV